MNIPLNLDLLSVGIVVAATGVLGFVIYYNNRASATNRIFLFFSFITIVWSVLNYLSYKVTNPNTILWLLRWEIFWATWWVYCMYLLLHTFPSEKVEYPKHFTAIGALAVLVSCLNLSSLVFIRVSAVTIHGTVLSVENGPGIALFGLFVLAMVSASIVTVYRKTAAASGQVRRQFRAVLYGFTATFGLLVTFNFILPAFLNTPDYIALGGVFVFPFILFTGYAIFRHGLLNVKVISTEILTFVLAIAVLIEVLFSQGLAVLIFRFSLFLLVLGIGIMLIQSVVREVKQRQKLQELDQQLEAANMQLKALDKARAEFISMVSHQMRTPPATLKWYLSSVLTGDFGPLPAELKEAMEKINLTNNAQISLIEDMLNVSRIERGKMEFAFAETNIAEITQTTVDVLMPFARTKKLKLIYRKPKTQLPMIYADKEKLRQVINNLIDNAIKYTKVGAVTVDLRKSGELIVLSVTDTGKGIRPEEREKIFDKFGRAQDSSNYAAGLGLGLFVAKVIMAQHQGKISADSPGEGKGSTFTITLPLKTPLNHSSTYDFVAAQPPSPGSSLLKQ